VMLIIHVKGRGSRRRPSGKNGRQNPGRPHLLPATTYL
jgi:hypothetical protein